MDLVAIASLRESNNLFKTTAERVSVYTPALSSSRLESIVLVNWAMTSSTTRRSLTSVMTCTNSVTLGTLFKLHKQSNVS